MNKNLPPTLTSMAPRTSTVWHNTYLKKKIGIVCRYTAKRWTFKVARSVSWGANFLFTRNFFKRRLGGPSKKFHSFFGLIVFRNLWKVNEEWKSWSKAEYSTYPRQPRWLNEGKWDINFEYDKRIWNTMGWNYRTINYFRLYQ